MQITNQNSDTISFPLKRPSKNYKYPENLKEKVSFVFEEFFIKDRLSVNLLQLNHHYHELALKSLNYYKMRGLNIALKIILKEIFREPRFIVNANSLDIITIIQKLEFWDPIQTSLAIRQLINKIIEICENNIIFFDTFNIYKMIKIYKKLDLEKTKIILNKLIDLIKKNLLLFYYLI